MKRWISIIAGVLFVGFLVTAYILTAPLSELRELGGGSEEWTQTVSAFKKEYGGYDWENMDILPGETPVVYFNQADEAWGSMRYDTRNINSRKMQTIRSGGCGPTSLAIVYSSLVDADMTPVEAANFAMENGFCAAPQGSYRSLFTSGAEKLGLTCYYSGEDLETALGYLSEGKLIVSLMGPGIFCNGGHFVVIRGITEDGKILLADCWNAANNDTEWDINVIAENLKTDGHGCLWVLGVEEIGENE